jgi:hypothetical protein
LDELRLCRERYGYGGQVRRPAGVFLGERGATPSPHQSLGHLGPDSLAKLSPMIRST